jgi:hypothetical protein
MTRKTRLEVKDPFSSSKRTISQKVSPGIRTDLRKGSCSETNMTNRMKCRMPLLIAQGVQMKRNGSKVHIYVTIRSSSQTQIQREASLIS